MKKGGTSGPSATRAAPVRVARLTISVGLLLVGEGERVAEDEAALGVGVVDLDGQALARGQDVARAHRRRGDRVLDRRDEQAQPDVETERP